MGSSSSSSTSSSEGAGGGGGGSGAKSKGPKSSLPANPKQGHVYNVKTTELAIDPERFQFKTNVNAEGVNEELRAAKKFNPDFAGVLSVWKDPKDGKSYVINGHHRYDLAKITGHETLSVRYIQAANSEQARAKGALINIAEGRGTAIDAAKFMRDGGQSSVDFEAHGISLKGKIASDATALAALSPQLFQQVSRGHMEVERAITIGRELPSQSLQDQLARIIEKAEKKKGANELSTKSIEEMAREMAATPTRTVTESSLFGDIESEHSLFVQRAEVKAFIRTELAKDRKDFELLSNERRAANVTRGGNKLNVEKNKEIAQKAAVSAEDFNREANRVGPVSETVNEFARQFAEAKTHAAREKVKKAALAAVKKKLASE